MSASRRHDVFGEASQKLAQFLILTAALLSVGCDRRSLDATRGVSPVCRIHHSQMFKTNVPITYGLVALNEYGKAFAAASSNNFPHADEEFLGGCIVGRNSPTQATIYVCSQCLTVRTEWESKQAMPR